MIVENAAAFAGATLDAHRVAAFAQLAHARRRHADSILTRFDFFRYADDHAFTRLTPRGLLQGDPQKGRDLRGVALFYLTEQRGGMQNLNLCSCTRCVKFRTIRRIEADHCPRRR